MTQTTRDHRLSLTACVLILLLGLGTLTSCGRKAGPGAGTLSTPSAGAGSAGGGGSPAGGGGANGTVVLLLRDAPVDDVLALHASITGINLVSSSRTVSLLTDPIEQEFRGLLLRNALLAQRNVPVGNYTSVEITLAAPSITFFNSLAETFVQTTPDFPTSSTSVTVSVNVTAGRVTPLLLELDLVQSITFTQSGTQLTPSFRPRFTARVIDLSVSGDNLARVDDLLGTVSNLNTTNNTFSFTPFGLNTAVTVSVDSATRFANLTGLSGLANDNLIDLDAGIQTSGDYLAEEIDLRGTSSLIELRGPVVEIVRQDSLNNVTRFNLIVREATEEITDAGVGELVRIRVVPGQTTFRVDSFDLPVENFTFDAQSILVGQGVAVELDSTENLDGFLARSITLKLEAMRGTVGQEIGQTTFSFVPSSDLLLLLLLEPRGLNRMTVSTSLETQFENLSAGFGSITANSTVTARGLLFSQFDQPVLVAKRIRAEIQ